MAAAKCVCSEKGTDGPAIRLTHARVVAGVACQ